VIWAASTAAVFRSADRGATWTDVSRGAFVDVRSIAVHPTNANIAWAIDATGHVYRTGDGGATWRVTPTPLLSPRTLLIDPHNPDTLYAGGDCGEITLEGPIDYDAHGAGVLKSTNGGASWTLQTAGLDSTWSRCAYELSIDPFASWRLFISGPFSDVGGQSESYDGANSWEHFFRPRPARGVVFDTRYPCTHYGITSAVGSHVMVSQDCGFTWADAPGKLPGTPLSLSIDPERGRLFLGTDKGIFRSGDGARVWATTLAPETATYALSFAAEPPALFAATAGGLIQVENRGLGAAHTIDLPQIATDIGALAVDPNNGNIVYASRRDAAGVFRSSDGGASWQRLSGDVPRIDFLSVDGGGTLYGASLLSQSVYRRDSDGWTVVRDHVHISELTADPKNAGIVFIERTAEVERTRDAGATWTPVTRTMHNSDIAIDPVDSRWVYIANDFQLLRSSDGGDTWTDIEPFNAGKTGGDGIVVAPSDRNVLYRISGWTGHLQRSDDRGATWQSFGAQAPYVGLIAVDPHDASSVWVTAYEGLEHSADGGATWQHVDTPYPEWTPQALRFDPSGQTLHVAFQQHGVWELPVATRSGSRSARSGRAF
jgi:photosystem II stability/assembly factor-like uncharacterized protein